MLARKKAVACDRTGLRLFSSPSPRSYLPSDRASDRRSENRPDSTARKRKRPLVPIRRHCDLGEHPPALAPRVCLRRYLEPRHLGYTTPNPRCPEDLVPRRGGVYQAKTPFPLASPFFFLRRPRCCSADIPDDPPPARLAHAHAHVYATPLPPLSSPCPVYSGPRFNSLKKRECVRETCENASDNCPEKSGHPVLSGNGRA